MLTIAANGIGERYIRLGTYITNIRLAAYSDMSQIIRVFLMPGGHIAAHFGIGNKELRSAFIRTASWQSHGRATSYGLESPELPLDAACALGTWGWLVESC